MNLCYVLEMDKDMREIFGSIAGGAAYKFGLFFHKKTQSWTCGSPAKPVKLTENEAIQKAEEIRNDLVAGAEIISSFGPLNSTADYEQLYKQLEHISGINTVWRMKYYQMLFPILFAPFYGQDIQLDVLHFLNQTPSEIPFIRMGQIALFSKKCNIPGIVFGHIWGRSTNHNNKSNDSETNTLSDKKHKLHYWMYTVFDDTSWMECQQKEIMVLGMDDIGDYSQYDSKESLRQELISTYDNSTSRKNQALMAWNFANKLAINDVIFAKRSNTLVGKGIVTGDYIFDDSRQEYKNIRTVKWLQIGEWEHPGKSVAKRLTDITPYTDYIEKLITIFTPDELDDVDTQPEVDYPEYSSADFLSDVYMSEQDYETLVNVLKMKKNIILQGAPGVGKTTLALAFSRALGLSYKRIQFTPDTMPSDITGFSVYNKNTGELEYKPGAADCHLLLGDEINRTSPKTQAALLEVMEEGSVTVDGVTHVLPKPFICIATQNHYGTAGTQALPESQLDRFMVRLSIGYPERDSQVQILKSRKGSGDLDLVNARMNLDDVKEIQGYLYSIRIVDEILYYISDLCSATREHSMVELGVSPRGAAALAQFARARAVLKERDYVVPDDVREVFEDVCAHRLVMKPQAKIEGVTAHDVLSQVMKDVPGPALGGKQR